MSKYKEGKYTRQEKLIERSDIFSGDKRVLLGMSGGTDSSVAESSWSKAAKRL